MIIRESTSIRRPPAEVFALIADLERYPELIHGVTLWEACSDQRTGTGARYRVLMQVGSIEVGGVVELEEWTEGRTIAWSHRRGVHQWGRWSIEEGAPGSSELAFELGYRLTGPSAWIVERLTARIIRRNVTATLLAARRILEFERSGPG